MSMDEREVEKLAADIAVQSMAATKLATVVVAKTAMDVAATAQRLVPVDTSATKNSIGVDTMPGGLAAEVGPTTHYAYWLEHGTTKMAPHAFMGPALDRHTPDFVQAMEQVGDLRL